MMLEELDDVGVEWEEDERGRKVARLVVSVEYAVTCSTLTGCHRVPSLVVARKSS